jgi:hypothetical protein
MDTVITNNRISKYPNTVSTDNRISKYPNTLSTDFVTTDIVTPELLDIQVSRNPSLSSVPSVPGTPYQNSPSMYGSTYGSSALLLHSPRPSYAYELNTLPSQSIGNIFINIFVYMFLCLYIHTYIHTYIHVNI